MLNINMFGIRIVNGITNKCNVTLVINKENSSSYLQKVHFLQQCSKLHSLLHNICQYHVLCLYKRSSHNSVRGLAFPRLFSFVFSCSITLSGIHIHLLIYFLTSQISLSYIQILLTIWIYYITLFFYIPILFYKTLWSSIVYYCYLLICFCVSKALAKYSSSLLIQSFYSELFLIT